MARHKQSGGDPDAAVRDGRFEQATRPSRRFRRRIGRGDLIDKVVKIKRCAAVVKGGRRFSFAAMVVVGNGSGKVGWGYGKANEVPPSVEKAVKDGSRSMIEIPLDGRHDSAHGRRAVRRRPAWCWCPPPGHRRHRRQLPSAAVCEAAGIHDILTKSFGSTNPANLVKAAIDALKQLRTRHDVERLRGVSLT